MANLRKISLTYRFLRLPGFLDFDLVIKPELDKAGISEDTFELDCQSDPVSIPPERLQVYANILNCEVEDLKSPSPRHA